MVEFEGAETGRRAVDAASYAKCTFSAHDSWSLGYWYSTVCWGAEMDWDGSGMAELLGDANLREQVATKYATYDTIPPCTMFSARLSLLFG